MNKRNYKGITLIALVITIVVLIILASIVIAFALQNNGIMEKSKQAISLTNKAKAKETIELYISEWNIENKITGVSLNDFLVSKGIKIQEEDEKIRIFFEKFEMLVDQNGNIVENIQDIVPRPQIIKSSIKKTLQDGTEIENYSQKKGTILKITFNVQLNDGTIGSIETVEPNTSFDKSTGTVTYVTDGSKNDIEFILTCELEEKTQKENAIIEVYDKYKTIEESDIKLVKVLNSDTEQEVYTLNKTQTSMLTYEWESSNNSVATVNENGQVTPIGKGSAVITSIATTSSGEKIIETCNANVDEILYLYNKGNKYPADTGGWCTVKENSQIPSYGVVAGDGGDNRDNIYISSDGGDGRIYVLKTVNMINLNNYSSVNFEFIYNYCWNSSWTIKVGITQSTTREAFGKWNNYGTGTKPSTSSIVQTQKVNISSITNSQYVAFGGNGRLYVYKVWLEK